MHRISKRRFQVESLESRTMLAGDVRVRVTNDGDLKISGDGLANSITIAAGAVAGTIDVTGVNTTINRGAAATVNFPGVVGDIEIKMKKGNDTVVINALTAPGDLKIDTGKDNDTVTLNANLIVTGKLDIKTRVGNDTVTATDVEAGKLKIKTAFGNDSVDLTDIVINDAADNDGLDVSINTSFGNDSVDIDGLTASRLKLRTGEGADEAELNVDVDDLSAKMGHGDDDLTLTNEASIAFSLSLRGGAGADSLDNNLTATPARSRIRSFETVT